MCMYMYLCMCVSVCVKYVQSCTLVVIIMYSHDVKHSMESSVFHYCVQPYLLRQCVSLTWNLSFLLVWLDSKLLESGSLPSKAGISDLNAVCLLHRCWKIKYKSTFYLTISPVSNASLIEYSEFVKLREVKGVAKA